MAPTDITCWHSLYLEEIMLNERSPFFVQLGILTINIQSADFFQPGCAACRSVSKKHGER